MRVRILHVLGDLLHNPKRKVWESAKGKDVESFEWCFSTIDVLYTDGSSDEVKSAGQIIAVDLF